MVAVNKIRKIIKIPLKFIYYVGSSPVKFVSNKQKKLIKIVTFSNVRVVAVKISRTGKKIIVTIAFIVSILSSSGVENQKMIESSCIFPAKSSIERVIELPNGGAINHPWSPGAKYEANSTKTSSGKAPNLRGRRLLSIPGSNSRSNSGQQLSNPSYKSAPSVNDNIPKSGKGIRVRSIATTDENGEMEIIYYNKTGQIIDGLAESKFLDDVNLVSDGSQNPTDQQIQSETKSQTEDVHNQNSGLTKVRKNLTPVEDDKLTLERDFVHPSQLTSEGRYFIDQTKDSRAATLLQSKYESKDKEFLPAYSPKQLTNKEKHILEVLDELNKNITTYTQGSKSQKVQVSITIVESLLAQPDTELYMNVMGQGREPMIMVLNLGRGNYPLPNHIATFERRPEISKYNHYIPNYLAKPQQIEKFDASNSSSITYEDLVGNSHTNIGPVFGKTDSPTSAPTVNGVDSEL